MHDAKGRELKQGDKVVFIGKVTEIQATEEYYNVSVESSIGRRPDGQKEKLHALNTGVLLRANEGDENDIPAEFVAYDKPADQAQDTAKSA